MLAHAEVVKPPALTVYAMKVANDRARRLGEPVLFARVRQRTANGHYVYRWVRIPRAAQRQTSVGGAVTVPSVTAPVVAVSSVPVINGGLENGIPVR
jgi:hypothetical protein